MSGSKKVIMKYNQKGLLYSLSAIVFAGLVSSCSPASDKLIPLPVVNYEKVDLKNNDVFRRPSVDILFVVDNSGSMSTYQQNVADNMDQFVNEFSQLKLIDYHIGVITTDSADNGQLEGIPTYVEPSTVDGLNKIKKNLKVGTNGSPEEELFGPTSKALSKRLLAGYNSGFYRQDAYLVIIFVSDAEDQSNISARDLMDELVLLKGTKDKILSYGAIIPTGTATSKCSQDEGNPIEVEKFLAMNVNAGKNIVGLCDRDFGTRLVNFSKEIVQVINKPIVLSKVPIIPTILVKYGAQVIPSNTVTGWYFDPKQNAILFGEDLYLDEEQPPGSKLDVFFDSVEFGQ
jgi:hypothetical protein